MGQYIDWCLPACLPQGACRRKVGRERRLSRLLLEQDRLERQELVQLRARAGRKPCGLRNIRTGTLLSPQYRTFAAEYQMTRESVGKGMSGLVMLARPRQEPCDVVAVKTLEKKGLSRREVRDLQREAEIYLRMDHVHIARLLRVFDERSRTYLVMEYCSGGSLEDRLHARGRFTEPAAAEAVTQVLSAVNYCHSRPHGAVCHRDLKLANFVYAGGGDSELLKLVDFGLSRVLAGGTRMLNCAGTLDFMAPEVLRRGSYDESCDLWSVGVMAHCLLTGRRPFRGATEAEISQAIQAGQLDAADEAVGHLSKDFVARLLRTCPSERPTAAEATRHPWLAGVGRRPTSTSAAAPLDFDPEVLESVRSFACESPANRAAAAMLVYADGAPFSMDAKIAEEQFCMLDTDGNGTLSPAELTGPLQHALGISEEEGQRIFDGIDLVNDHEIERSEFLTAALGLRLADSESAIRKAFNRLDLDQNGTIEPAELTAVLGERFCGEPAMQIFNSWDSSGQQAISLEQFAAVFQRLRWAAAGGSALASTKLSDAVGSDPLAR